MYIAHFFFFFDLSFVWYAFIRIYLTQNAGVSIKNVKSSFSGILLSIFCGILHTHVMFNNHYCVSSIQQVALKR